MGKDRIVTEDDATAVIVGVDPPSCPLCKGAIEAAALQECSSVGRASVSKTEGPRFESVHSCQSSPGGSDRLTSLTIDENRVI